MIIDIGYWSKVTRRIIILFFSILGIYLIFKLAIYYLPFLIAFIISLLIEPIIKFTTKKTHITRKTSAIIILLITFALIIAILTIGIITLISESSNLLTSINYYYEKATRFVQNILTNHFSKIKIPEEIKIFIENTSNDLLSSASVWIKNILSNILNIISLIPTVTIYIVITILSIYFISTDKLYMLDQFEHHVPKKWVRKIIFHLKEIINTLGNYLKAELILILISFIITTIGLFFFKIIGLNVEYPLLAAIVIGFVDALPILGSGTIIIPWAIISAINGELNLSLSLIILYTIIIISRQLIEPKLISNNIGIHPIFTLISMYTGFKISGLIGLLIGPIVLIIFKDVFSTLIDNGVVKTIFDRY